MSDETNPNETNVNLAPYPYEKAVDTAVSKGFDAADKFLGKIMSPALGEIGGILQDQFGYWRKVRQLTIAQKMEKKLKELGHENYHAPPRLIHTGFERGSLVEPGDLQDMWAGLLASSCTEDGEDDSNLLFMNLLDQLSKPQARILRHACESATKKKTIDGLIYAENYQITFDELVTVAGISDVQRLDRELDRLRTLELILGGFPLQIGGPEDSKAFPAFAGTTPTAVALHMYVRCQGVQSSPVDYFTMS